MRYEKPVILNLNARAQSVSGQLVTLGCHSGGGANAGGEQCETGGGGGSYPVCEWGNSPGNGDCISGSSAYYCESGAGASNGGDPNGCRVGPSH